MRIESPSRAPGRYDRVAYFEKERLMKTRQVVLNADVPFRQVDWVLTKDLVGPEHMGAEKIRFKITEYL